MFLKINFCLQKDAYIPCGFQGVYSRKQVCDNVECSGQSDNEKDVFHITCSGQLPPTNSQALGGVSDYFAFYQRNTHKFKLIYACRIDWEQKHSWVYFNSQWCRDH